MVKDTPATNEHGRRRHVMRTNRGTVMGEVFVLGIH
jgi:hypothetical protein